MNLPLGAIRIKKKNLYLEHLRSHCDIILRKHLSQLYHELQLNQARFVLLNLSRRRFHSFGGTSSP